MRADLADRPTATRLSLPRLALALYLAVLLWLVLFKLSADPVGVLLHYRTRSVNLTPFAGFRGGNARGAIDNCLVFVPLGLLLGITHPVTAFWRKVGFVLALSATVETLQFVLAIGAADATDVVMNTLGGLLGLTLHAGIRRVAGTRLDPPVAVVVLALLAVLVAFRVLVFQVRY